MSRFKFCRFPFSQLRKESGIILCWWQIG